MTENVYRSFEEWNERNHVTENIGRALNSVAETTQRVFDTYIPYSPPTQTSAPSGSQPPENQEGAAPSADTANVPTTHEQQPSNPNGNENSFVNEVELCVYQRGNVQGRNNEKRTDPMKQ